MVAWLDGLLAAGIFAVGFLVLGFTFRERKGLDA